MIKNEEKQIEAFLENTKKADKVVFLDSGSTDGTLEKLKNKVSERIELHIMDEYLQKNFRFDEVQNTAISLLPDEYACCISLDLDERLVDTWKEDLDSFFAENIKENENFTLYFDYVNSWKDKERTLPGIIYKRNKIHTKYGGKWIYPVFNQYVPTETNTKVLTLNKILIKHYQEERSERNPFYEELIRTAIINEPKVADYHYSYAEMLYGNKEYEKAFNQWKLFLEKTEEMSLEFGGVAQRRSMAYRNMVNCTINSTKDLNLCLLLMLKSVSCCPYYREVWVQMARIWLAVGDSMQAIACIETAKSITNRDLSIVIDEDCWDDKNLMNLSSLAFKQQNEK